jgi:hypothetical protein
VLEDTLTTFGFKVGFVVWFRVGCVCWRHTTRSDGTWVWWMLASDVNVRSSGRFEVRGVVRRSRKGVFFCKLWWIVRVRSTLAGMYFDFEVGGARAVGRT